MCHHAFVFGELLIDLFAVFLTVKFNSNASPLISHISRVSSGGQPPSLCYEGAQPRLSQLSHSLCFV